MHELDSRDNALPDSSEPDQYRSAEGCEQEAATTWWERVTFALGLLGLAALVKWIIWICLSPPV